MVKLDPHSAESIPVRPDWDNIERELAAVVNRYGLDSWLSTPDFMVADLIVDNMKLMREFLKHRHDWRGDGPVCKEKF